MADGKVVYQIVGESKGLAADMAKAEGVIQQSVAKWDSIAAGAAKAVGAAFAAAVATGAAALTALGKQGLEYNAQMEKYQTAFTTLLGSAKEAAEIMAQIKEDAAVTPFDVDGLTKAVQLLVAADLEADDARVTILALGDAIAATGGGDDELMRMAQNLQQVKNVGTAAAIDIKQFAMAGINIYQVLADYLGITAQQASEMEVTFEVLQAALIAAADEGGKYFGAMANQSQTLNGAVSNLQDSFGQFTGRVTEGLSKAAIVVVTALSDMFNSMSPLEDAIKGIFNAIGDVVVNALPSIKSGIDTLGEAVGMVIPKLSETKELLFAALETLLDIVPTTSELKALLPSVNDVLTAISGIIPVLVETLTALTAPLDKITLSTLPELGTRLFELIGSLGQLALDLLPVVASFIGELVGTLGDIAFSILPSLFDMTGALLPIIRDIAKDILPLLNRVLDEISPVLKAVFEHGVKPIGDMLIAVLPTLQEIASVILEKIAVLIERLSPGVEMLAGKLKPLIDLIGKFAKAVIDLIRDALEPLIDLIVTVLASAFETICTGLEPVIDVLTEVAGIVVDVAIAALTAFIDTVKALALAVKQAFEGDIAGAFENLITSLSDIFSNAAGQLEGFVDRCKRAVTTAQNAAAAVASAIGSIGDVITGKISVSDLVSNAVAQFNAAEAEADRKFNQSLSGSSSSYSGSYTSSAAHSTSKGTTVGGGGGKFGSTTTINTTVELDGRTVGRSSVSYLDDNVSGTVRGN